MNPEDLITEITEGRSSNDAANLTDVNVEEEMKKLRPEIEEWYDRWRYDMARNKEEDETSDEDDNETIRGVDDEDDNETVCGEDEIETIR